MVYGDIVTNRAAKAYAAYNGRDKVTTNDIAKIIIYVYVIV
jgi:Mg-chelatase subunit ChlI